MAAQDFGAPATLLFNFEINMPMEKTSTAAKVCDRKAMFIVGLTSIVIIITMITWVIKGVTPARSLLTVTTPVPLEHYYDTLPYHEQKHRQSYLNNTFIQMLHHTHNATHVTNCWVCGMMPAHQKKGGTPFIPLPFSHNGSCQAGFALLWASEVANITYADVGRLNLQLNKVCYPDEEGDPKAKGTVWKMEEYCCINTSMPYVFPNTQTVKGNGPPVIAVTRAQADPCVNSIGSIPVGKSDCTLVLNITGANNCSFMSSHNTYFICGNEGYYHLTIGWSGTCYVSFLLPPVFLAPASYHKDYERYNDIFKSRSKSTINYNEVEQTDTALQQYVEFNLGLSFFVGATLNSRKNGRLTRVVEAVTNQIAMALGNIIEELQIAIIVELQNRMGLDVVLADRGGACCIIRSSCCVFIPDHAPSVFDEISKLHKIAAEIHPDTGIWTFTGGLLTLFVTWGWKQLTVLHIFFAILLLCCLCLQCGPMLCSLCTSACIPTKSNVKNMNAQYVLDQEVN